MTGRPDTPSPPSETDAAAFLESAETLRAVLDAARVPMFVVDLASTVLLRNLAHKRWLAQNGIAATRSSLHAAEIVGLVEDPESLRAFTERLAGEPEREHEQGFSLLSSGRKFTVRSSPLRARLGGAVLGHVLAVNQVTDDENWRRESVLDARTPLTAIRGFAELLLGADLSGDARSVYLETVREQCERLEAALARLYDGPA